MKNKMLMIHWPSLRHMESCVEKELLEEFFVNMNSMWEQRREMEDNFIRLKSKNLPECHKLRSMVKGKMLAVVAAGPSLDQEIENLKMFRKEIVIIAVGRCAKKLEEYNIKPDIIVIIDAGKDIHRQVEGLKVTDIPLILLSTASADIVDYYAGPIYVAYQTGYVLAEQTAYEKGYNLFKTGGSVTTLALDIAIMR